MLKRQILQGTSWLLAGRIFSNVVGLASTLIAARFLMPEDFGVVAIAMGVFGIAAALVELPVGTALVQLKTATKDDFNTAWTINFLRGLIVAVMMAASAWPIAIVFDDPRLLAIVLALASYPVLLGLRNAWFEQYTRDMDFRWEALVETLTKVVSFAVVLGISIATRSYWALPLSLIGKFVGTSRLGAWSVGSQFADRLELVLYAPMERTLFAAFSSIRHDAEHLRGTFLKAMHTGFAFIAPVCVGMGLLSPEVIAITLGPKWSVAALVLGFIAPAMAFHLLAGLCTSLTTALGHTRAVFQVKVISALVHLPMILAGVYFAGLQGALWATVVTAVIWWGLCASLISRIAGISLASQAGAIVRSAGAVLIMASVVITARAMLFAEGDDALVPVLVRAVSLSGLGALTYVVSHFVLWQLAGRSAGVETAALGLVSGRRPGG